MVSGSTEGELLVKSIAVQEYGKGTPDCMNIQNAAKEYIVPGSSLQRRCEKSDGKKLQHI